MTSPSQPNPSATLTPDELAKSNPLLLKRQERSWILYDCANSAFSLIISTALFPVFFGMQSGDPLFLGYVNSIASIIIAALSPILGTIADYKDKKKRFFLFFFFIGIMGTFSLAFVPAGQWKPLALLYVLASVGYAGSNIFYDSFLVDVTTEERSDLVSTRGFAYGYIASIIPFLIGLGVIYFAGMDKALGFQVSFFITAVWWLCFTLPMIRNVRQAYYIQPQPKPIRMSFQRLYHTFKDIRKYKMTFLFLLAYFFYIDGVDTLIRMVIPYATSVLNEEISVFYLLGILLMIQIIAFPFSLLFGRLTKRFGTLFMIRVGILIYVVVAIYGSLINSLLDCILLGAMVAFAQGGIQSLSRSYFSRLIPKDKSNEFFGFYNIFGKFSAIIGPTLMTLTERLTGMPRLSMTALLPLFLIGFLLTLKLPKVTVREE